MTGRQQLADDAERLLHRAAASGEVTGEDVIAIRDLIGTAWNRKPALASWRHDDGSAAVRELSWPPGDGAASGAERRAAKAETFRELYGAGPLPGAGLVIHPLSRAGTRRTGWARFWQLAGFLTAPAPDDGRRHPYGQACALCSVVTPPDCDHGMPVRQRLVNGQCRRCGEDVFRSLGSVAGMRAELVRRGAGFGQFASVRDLAWALDASEAPESQP